MNPPITTGTGEEPTKNHKTMIKEATGVDLITLIMGVIKVLQNSNRFAIRASRHPVPRPMKKPKRTRKSECNKHDQKTEVARREMSVLAVSRTDGKIKSVSNAKDAISQTESQKITAKMPRNMR